MNQIEMTKTLQDAIGCWTTYSGGLHDKILLLRQSRQACARLTRQNKSAEHLLDELMLFHQRAETLLEMLQDAERRCREIIETEELSND